MIAKLAVCLALLASLSSASFVVNTTYGPVAGTVDSQGGWKCNAFRGIRYAAPPTGSLRFSYAEPPAAHSDVYNATDFGASCPQNCSLPPHTCPTVQNEDCLFLNVFTPTGSSPSSSLPVMFFIHGGHFEQGNGNGPFYSGLAASSQDNAVVVTINYRLGALGWLLTDGITGNYGLSDQILALKWVQANIARFGGDPSSVTIYGQSAGGTSVSTLMTSPAAAGLFSNVIVESNPIGLPIMGADEGASLGAVFAKDVGCASDDIGCLRSASVDSIIAAQKKAGHHINLHDLLQLFYPWAPAIDGKMVLDEPLNLLRAGKVANPPETLVMGTVLEEGRIFIYMAHDTPLSALAYDAIVGAVFAKDLHFTKVLKMFPATPPDSRDQLGRIATYYLFRCPTRAAVRGMQSVVPTYEYLFNHSWSFDGWGPDYQYCVGHVCHGEELPFVFDLSTTDIVKFSSEEAVLGAQMSAAWTSVPSGSIKASPSWPQRDPSTNLTYVWSAPSPSVIANLDDTICDLFDEIGYNF